VVRGLHASQTGESRRTLSLNNANNPKKPNTGDLPPKHRITELLEAGLPLKRAVAQASYERRVGRKLPPKRLPAPGTHPPTPLQS
jgi:hypothetical protein